MRCHFVSKWNDGTMITTPAEFDNITGLVSAKTVDIDPDGLLESEYIILPGGQEVGVCMICHEFTNNGPDKCRNPYCESHH